MMLMIEVYDNILVFFDPTMPPKYNTQSVGGSAPNEQQTSGPARQQENPARCPVCDRNMQGVDCVACGEHGHDWHVCCNRCLVCQQMHGGAVCPVMPELYDLDPPEKTKLQAFAKLTGEVTNMRNDIAARKQRLQGLKALAKEPRNDKGSSSTQQAKKNGPALDMLLR